MSLVLGVSTFFNKSDTLHNKLSMSEVTERLTLQELTMCGHFAGRGSDINLSLYLAVISVHSDLLNRCFGIISYKVAQLHAL